MTGPGGNTEEATYDRLDTENKDTNTGSAARCMYFVDLVCALYL